MLKYLTKYLFFPLFLYKEGNYQFLKLLKEVERNYELTIPALRNLRLLKLRNLCKYAYSESNYYRHLFNKVSFFPAEATFEDLKNIPSLTKNEISSNLDSIIPKKSRQHLKKDSTGGSTAEPFIFYRDQMCWYWKNAYQLYFNKLLGWDIGTKYALIWGASRDLYKRYAIKQKIKDKFIFRKIQLNATEISKEALENFVARLQNYNPEIIYGYPSAIYILCRYMEKGNLQLHSVRSVICTAEPLTDEYREHIGDFFNCDVFDRYTSREAGLLAQECSAHEGLHINSLSVHIEISNNKILVTDLDNYGMPLINYEIGDMAQNPLLKGTPCSCGLNTELLQLGASRETDFFVKRDGTIIFGAGIPIMKLTGEKGIKNIQIIQQDYEHFIINLVKTEDFCERNLSRIERVMREYLGNDIRIEYKYLQNIERVPSSGKYRYVISNINKTL